MFLSVLTEWPSLLLWRGVRRQRTAELTTTMAHAQDDGAGARWQTAELYARRRARRWRVPVRWRWAAGDDGDEQLAMTAMTVTVAFCVLEFFLCILKTVWLISRRDCFWMIWGRFRGQLEDVIIPFTWSYCTQTLFLNHFSAHLNCLLCRSLRVKLTLRSPRFGWD